MENGHESADLETRRRHGHRASVTSLALSKGRCLLDLVLLIMERLAGFSLEMDRSYEWEAMVLLHNRLEEGEKACTYTGVKYETISFDEMIELGVDLRLHEMAISDNDLKREMGMYLNEDEYSDKQTTPLLTASLDSTELEACDLGDAVPCDSDFTDDKSVIRSCLLTDECTVLLECIDDSSRHDKQKPYVNNTAYRTTDSVTSEQETGTNLIDKRLSELVQDIDGMAWHCCQIEQAVPGKVLTSFQCDVRGKIGVPDFVDDIAVLQQVEPRPCFAERRVIFPANENEARCLVETSTAEVRLLRIMQDVFRNKLQLDDNCATLRLLDRYIDERLTDAVWCREWFDLTDATATCKGQGHDSGNDHGMTEKYYQIFLSAASRSNTLIHKYRKRNVTVRPRRNR